jgi:hydrogenase maturation protein HypF
VGSGAAQTVQAMLARKLNCPLSTGAGRWFDAAAGALGISVRQAFEAEAAIALETLATEYLASHRVPDAAGAYAIDASGVLDLLPLQQQLFDLADSGGALAAAQGAALFHVALADALVEWATHAAQQKAVTGIALGGGCFMNRLMTGLVLDKLKARGMQVWLPQIVSCGDAGLALGQAWVARQQLRAAAGAG